MTVKELQSKLNLNALNEANDTEIDGAFISDMLSDVMAGAKAGNIWVTVQTHKNIVAAANLVDVPAIIVVRGSFTVCAKWSSSSSVRLSVAVSMIMAWGIICRAA